MLEKALAPKILLLKRWHNVADDVGAHSPDAASLAHLGGAAKSERGMKEVKLLSTETLTHSLLSEA